MFLLLLWLSNIYVVLITLPSKHLVGNTHSKFYLFKIRVNSKRPPSSHVFQFKQRNMWNGSVFLRHVKITRLHRFCSSRHSIQIQREIAWKRNIVQLYMCRTMSDNNAKFCFYGYRCEFLPIKSSAEKASASQTCNTTRGGTFSSDSSQEKNEA